MATSSTVGGTSAFVQEKDSLARTVAKDRVFLKDRLVFSSVADRDLVFPKGKSDSIDPVVVYEGYLTKRGTEKIIKRSNRRYCFLLESVFIVAKEWRQDKVQVRQCIPLEHASLHDCEGDDVSGQHKYTGTFKLIAPDFGRDFIFRAHPGRVEKDKWISALRSCFAEVRAPAKKAESKQHGRRGWQHNFASGTVYSYAVEGNLEKLIDLIKLYRGDKKQNEHGGEGQSSSGGGGGQNGRSAEQDEGWNVNAPDEDGATVLHLAVEYEHDRVVDYLLGNRVKGAALGVDVNACDYSLMSPLHYAAMRGNDKLVVELLKNGANYEARDIEDRTPLFSCVASAFSANVHTAAAPSIRQSNDPDAQDEEMDGAAGDTKIEKLIKCGELLLKAGADPDLFDQSGDSILMTASESNCTEAIQLLLSNGASSQLRRDSDRATALHLACARRARELCLPVIESLVRSGGRALLGMKNDKGETALLTVLNSPACLCGSKEGVRAARFLVNHGAVVDKEVHAIAGGLFTSAKGKGRSRGAAKKKSANKNVTIQHAPNVHGLEIQVPPKEKSTPDQSPGAGYTESPRSFA